MAPRGKRANATATKSLSSGLVEALKFISVAQRDTGQVYQTHCILARNMAVAFDGVVAAGVPIAEDIQACPQTGALVAALSQCGESLSITQLDGARLSIKSEKFQAYVPCVSWQELTYPTPDAPCATIDDRIRAGFACVGILASDTSQHVVTASVLLQANSMVSTNRHVMLEYWHGIDLPRIIIPKAFVTAITKSTKPLKQLGFSDNSVTFYFDDGSWIKSQRYADEWPDMGKILNQGFEPKPIPENFYKAVDAVASFSDDGSVRLMDTKLSSHKDAGVGAVYDCDLRVNVTLNAKYLKIAEPYAKVFDFTGINGISYFQGECVRGAISQVRE